MSHKQVKKPVNATTTQEVATKDRDNATLPDVPAMETTKVWCNRGPHPHKFMVLHPYANKTHSGIFQSSKKEYQVQQT